MIKFNKAFFIFSEYRGDTISITIRIGKIIKVKINNNIEYIFFISLPNLLIFYRVHLRLEALTEPSLHRNLPSAVHAFTPPLLLEQGLFPLASATLTKDKLKQTIRKIFLNITSPPT